MPRKRSVKRAFLNLPYDKEFESLFLAYVVGLIQLGVHPRLTFAIPNQGRLDSIIDLIDGSDFSIHDLSRTESTNGIPRFNMPLELGLALHQRRVTKEKHQVFIFETKPYRTQQSTSDVNGIDPFIHHGKPKEVMTQLRNIFRKPGDTISVPHMFAIYRAIRRRLPELKKNAGGGSLFESAIFEDIALAALSELQKRTTN
ncbi:MAG: hypothetical protein WBE76_17850 [Terracidiphilus sp.]